MRSINISVTFIGHRFIILFKKNDKMKHEDLVVLNSAAIGFLPYDCLTLQPQQLILAGRADEAEEGG